MLRERPAADTQHLLSAEPSYNLHDIMVKITSLPSAGVVLKADSLTPVVLGDTLTAAELAALNFAPTSLHSEERPPGNGLIIYVPQDCGRLPIPLFADLAAGTVADTPVVITELPSNGSVFLANGMTVVVRGQAITAAQLCGLTFRPAADAVGQISLLGYRGSEESLTEQVLLVVGPAVSSLGAGETAATGDNSSVSPIAVALLLEAGLSSLNATQASAAVSSNDLLPDSSAPSDVIAGTALQISGRATGFLPDHVTPGHITVPSSAILAQAAPTGIDTTGPTATETLKPRYHIGSSSPSAFGSLKLVSPAQSTTLTSTNVPGSIANNAVLEIKGPSGKTVSFDTGNGELILDHSAQFHGLIGSSSPGTPLSPNDLIDLKDLPFTSSMSASVRYDSATNISTVDFSNASKVVTLQFSGQDLNWVFKSDGQGGTIVADPPVTNPIAAENQLPGTPMSVWWVDPGSDSTKLEGFTTAMGTNVGGTVQFKIDNLTGSGNYTVSIYRLGYYQGDGARLITTINHTGSVIAQPNPITNLATGEVDAGNWSVTDSWAAPTTAVSGVYVANVTQGNQVFQIPFIISDPNSTSAILFQTNDETWQAYNSWGGADVYGGNGPGVNGSAYAVSYNRPIVTRDGSTIGVIGGDASSNDMVFAAEFPTIYWLEQNGYNVSYITGEQVGTAATDAVLLNHQVYMTSGHDEYWTDQQYNNVMAARAAGVNMMFLTGNETYWQTRFTTSIDNSATPNRTMVTYKDTHANQLIDPTGTATGTFMDARFASTGGLSGTPSNALTGQVFSVDSDRFDTITIPYGETQLRIWRNTSVANTAVGGTASLEPGLLGYEWDSAPNNAFTPAGLVDVSSTTLQVSTKLLDYGNATGNGTATHNIVEFRDPTSGALIFSTGTVFWSWGLSDQHDVYQGTLEPVDPRVQQATVNVLADMGVQPQTLQTSLLIASTSTDHTAPTSKITSISTSSPTEGQSVTVTGTATDTGGGVIGGIQVSADGGKTWGTATSNVGSATETWSYTFRAPGAGTYTLESRAVDDSINLETPSDGQSYTVKPTSNLSIFGTATPTASFTADDPVDVGVKFTSTTSGKITGIRFYKAAGNSGVHIGDLWSSTGALLASATFSGESASGWQQVNFSTPVQIQAGQTYIASYHTTTGYSYTDYYFTQVGAGLTNGSLTALGNGLDGVYGYGSSPTFPSTVSFANSDNFWVDVVYDDTGAGGPQANPDSGFTVNENGSITIATSTLLANDTDSAKLALSFTGVSGAVNGTVSYNAAAGTVTFTPTANYAGAASFSYSIADTSGATATGQVSLNVTYPKSAQSLFGTNDTPTQVNSNDGSAVELGVKFSASTNGTITGIRFYKGAANVGTHTADLWSSTGTLLATATFAGETASGWQTVTFSNPVSITAGTTYVAAYHTSGFYSDTPSFFAAPLTNGALTAPAAAGVYAYGTADAFPTQVYQSTNYYVDVVFNGGAAPPVANADIGFTAQQNTPLTIAASALLANDTDPNGQTPTISSVSAPVNGTVSYSSTTNNVTFTPTAGYFGAASFTYTITDTLGGTSSANVSLTVKAPPPVANPDTGFTTPQNTALNIAAASLLANDTDPDSLAMTVTGVSAPVNGTVSYNATNGTVTFTPTTGYSGAASFTYSISDTAGGTASANVSLTVKAPSAPVANPDSGFTTLQNISTTIAATTLLANDTDPNGLALSVTGVSAGVNGVANYNATTKAVTFTPTTGYNGPASFTYAIADTAGGTASSTVSLTVKAPQPLVATNDTGFSTNRNTALAINASQLLSNDTDPNGLTPTISGVSAPVNGTVAYNATTGVVTFTPTTGYTGAASFTYAISDAAGGTGSATVSLNVNTAAVPVANPDSGFTTLQNTATTIAASALLANDTDPNGLTPTISGVSSPVNGTVSYNATTNAVTFTPTIGYTGAASFTYMITDTAGGTSSALVSLTVKAPQPLVAVNDSGFSTSANTPITISAAQLLANDTDPNGLTPTLSSVSNAVNGTVSLSTDKTTITFTPTAGFTGAASFTYAIADTSSATGSASVALTVNAVAAGESLFGATATPANVTVADASSVELGVKFTADANGQITGIRFYKGPSNTGTHVADLWTSTGTLLASATFTAESASGWQQVNFATPVSITAGQTYIASYHTNVGEYSATSNYFTANVVSGDLTATASGNGVYAYGSGSLFPTNSFNNTNYWVDVVYTRSTGPQPPVAHNDSGFATTTNTALTINASQLLANDTDPNNLALSITGVSNPANGTVSYNASTQVATFTPTSNYTGPASFTYSIADANGGVASASVGLTVSDPSTASLFSATSTPSIATVNDPQAVELGVKFQSSTAGQITGLRFYKGPQNTGTHVADLWSSTGTLLAAATFTNETASGWQQVNFSTPVSITAGTTYIASYHTNVGEYSADPNLFANAVSNGPLSAPSSANSGGNGVYAYGSGSLFPTSTYNSTSYGVDVLFKQLAA
jgi:hypothetical protein